MSAKQKLKFYICGVTIVRAGSSLKKRQVQKESELV